jgi:phage terminase small subunit
VKKGAKVSTTKSGLTPLQENFCHEYLIDLDPANAYQRAGYSAKTRDQASKNASNLMRNHKVAMRIQELVEQRNRSTDVTAERVVEELARIGFFDPRTVMGWGPKGVKWLPSEELADAAAAVVAGVEQTEREMDDGGVYRTNRIRFHDKMAALKELAKHTGVGQRDEALVNVNIEAEKTKATEYEQLFREIDDWRAKHEQSLPEERVDVS